MSDTVGVIVILIGLALSGVGLYLLSRTRRQGLGLALMLVGLFAAGTGFLAIDDSQVTERPPATIEGVTPEA